MKSTNGTIRPASRAWRWLLLAAVAVFGMLIVAGCGGGVNIAPLSQKAFEDLGKEMVAIEQTPPVELVAIARLKPTEIELIEALTPAQLANIRNLTDNEISSIQLGVNTAVIAGLTPAQKTFIRNLKLVDDIEAVTSLAQRRVNAIDAQAAANKKAPNPSMAPKDREAFATFWRGYIAETRASVLADINLYVEANTLYQQTLQAGGGYGAQARYRLAMLGLDTRNLLGPESSRTARTHLQALSPYRSGTFGGSPEIMLWVRNPALAAQEGAAAIGTKPATAATPVEPVLYAEEAPTATTAALDSLYRSSGGTDSLYYRVVSTYVHWFDFAGLYGAALALIIMSLLIKLVTIPLTNASFRGMRDMQKIQPMLKELQEKYKDDKQTFAQEQMKLMKEHKVNPLGGCLPLLIQLPIFIVVYRAVQVYSAGFAGSQFLWIPNLARPDLILLLLYTVSMIVTQKLTATPSNDPQQKMMQTQMTYFMPIFLLIVLKNIASAFVLYWFFLNVFSSIHQYYLIQQFKREDEAKAAAVPAAGSRKKKGK